MGPTGGKINEIITVSMLNIQKHTKKQRRRHRLWINNDGDKKVSKIKKINHVKFFPIC